MLKRLFLFVFVFSMTHVWADTIDHYMSIAGNIPKMEINADPQAQLWARSARNVLTLTCDSIAETLNLANSLASKHGTPLFCPKGATLDAAKLNDLIQQTYHRIASQQGSISKMTVSEVALQALQKEYPCSKAKNSNAMMHMSGLNDTRARDGS